MLTATYSLVAMATEQENTCNFLERSREAIASLWQYSDESDIDRLRTTLLGLVRFDHYCHQRKVEKYVIPAVQGTSREIDAIVGDLESLSGVGMNLLADASEQLRLIFDRRTSHLLELCQAMDSYCDCLQQRLRREEEELLPLVRRMLSVEDWFRLAAQFLGDERQPRLSGPTLSDQPTTGVKAPAGALMA